MSRNKENNPLLSTQRNGLHSRNLPTEEFFTDSLLDDSRHSNNSLIPSPSKAKAKPGSVKPRRAAPTATALQAAKDAGNKQSRLRDYTNARLSKQPPKPVPKFTKKKSPSPNPSPSRTDGLTTPPPSRHGPPIRSPSEFSSPPGGLHESYQRIADEEDLAATERDVDSDDVEVEDNRQDTSELNTDANPPQETAAGSERPLDDVSATDHSTPIQSHVNLDEMTGSFSAPPTLDFVQNELSDRVLAAKLTPHFVDRTRDRQRLQRLRQSVPINFGDGPSGNQVNEGPRPGDLTSIANRGPIYFDNINAAGANGKARSDPSVDGTLKKRFTTFGKAIRRAPVEADPENDDGSDTPDELREVERTINFNRTHRRRERFAEENERQTIQAAPRLGAFSRSNGIRQPFLALPQRHDDQPPPDDPTIASVSSVHSEPVSVATADKRTTDATRSVLARWRHEAAQRRAAKTQESNDDLPSKPEAPAPAGRLVESRNLEEDADSEVDWVNAGADVPMPSIEKSSTPRDTPPPKVLPSPISKQRSMDRVRKWENDFTGMSFQVSESPPVRGRNTLNDSLREMEIENLTKKAVTSNRLDEIRVKDPNVVVRKTSRNLTPEKRNSVTQESEERLAKSQMNDNQEMGQLIPDTPVVVYRSSSQSTNNSKSSEGLMPDSLDQLQRLVRAVSTTPRASPALHQMVREAEEASAISLPPSEADPRASSPEAHRDGVHQKNKVAETPKVVGAWPDTILSDTVRTQKATQKLPKYTQTPHVSAGGWIDTPIATSDRLPRVPIPETVEEVTEDMTNVGFPEPIEELTEPHLKLDQSTLPNQESKLSTVPLANQQIALPSSALTNVLNEAKQKRLVSRDITDDRPPSGDDTETLNLGDATLQSMEDLLTDAADITADLTTLIKANAQEEVLGLRQRNALLAPDGMDEGDSSTSDVAFIGHLTSRMERLMSNLHEARKGITRLELRVAQTPTGELIGSEQQTQALVAGHDPTQVCTACGGNDGHLRHIHDHPKITSFLALPVAYTTFTLPIPLLFHPKPATSKAHGQLSRFLPGRPTWLGYLTLALWSWYILECTMTELYARPLYATRYAFPPPGVREPEFPFVLPTMLYRWTLGGTGVGVLLAPIIALVASVFGAMVKVVVAFYRIFAMAIGWSDGFVDDDRANVMAAAATKSAVKMIHSVLAGTEGEGLSMMNDEML